MVGSQTVFSILDEAPAAIGGWSAIQSIRCVHLDSEAVAVAPSFLELEGALLKRNFPGSIRCRQTQARLRKVQSEGTEPGKH